MNMKNSKKWLKRKRGAKKVDLKATKKLLENETYFVYWPSPTIDIEQYKDEKGLVDVDKIPDEDLFEFECRYLSGAELSELENPKPQLDITAIAKLRDNDKLTKDKVTELATKALEEQLFRNPDEQAAQCVYKAVLDPKFESPQQVLEILPLELIYGIFNEAMTFLDRGMLKTKTETNDVN